MQRSVIVTGGFGNLGRVVAEAFARRSFSVARIDHAPTPPAGPFEGLDIGSVDLTDPTVAAAAVAEVKARFGAIDALVNIAGGFAWETLMDGDLATWARMQAMNLTTAATITQAALPSLLERPGSRIINIGAGAALSANAGMGAYAAAKSGVHRLTESLADELAGHDITVNAVLPSIIDTPENRAAMPDADFRTWVAPAAVADVILFLASPESRAISGALIPVTRGA